MKRTRLSLFDDFPNSLIDAVICDWIHSERDRRILHYKLIDGLTYEKIAEKEELSTECIKGILRKAEKRLYNHLIVEDNNPREH